jgi:predicted amidophosphoribosyltransferase
MKDIIYIGCFLGSVATLWWMFGGLVQGNEGFCYSCFKQNFRHAGNCRRCGARLPGNWR